MEYIQAVENSIYDLLENVRKSNNYSEFRDVLEICDKLKEELEGKESKESKKMNKEIKKLSNKIFKYTNKYPYLQKDFTDEFNIDAIINEDDEQDKEQAILDIEEKLRDYKRSSKLFDEINLDTSVYKVFLIIRKIFHNKDDFSKKIKNSLKLKSEILKGYGIETLNDLVQTSRKKWNKIFEETKDMEEFEDGDDLKQQMNNVAVLLYPMYIFDIDADYLMADIAWFVKYPGQDFTESNVFNEETNEIDIKGFDTVEDFYNEIYHGFNIPEAPPSPFPFSLEGVERKEGKKVIGNENLRNINLVVNNV
jgi:hypothetical protein